MSLRMQNELDKLRKKIFALGGLVEERVFDAVRSIQHKDATLAKSIIAGDHEVDSLEVELEEDCLKLLALHQPVAIDLRYIVAILKINNDLERVGDLAVNIAGRSLSLCEGGHEVPPPFDLAEMARKTREMLRMSLDSLCNLDMERAFLVRGADSEIDAMNRKMYALIEEKILKDAASTHILLQYMSVSKYLERVADHATNIAEDVIYMISGEIIRHRFPNTMQVGH